MNQIVASNTGGGYGEEDDDVGMLSFDAVSDLLSCRRRRYVVECLNQFDAPISLADLADECVEMEHGTCLESIPAETVMQTYMSLYHAHIPELADAHIVQYDQESDSVALGPNVSQIESHLDRAQARQPPAIADALDALRPHLSAIDEGISVDRATSILSHADCDETVRILEQLEDAGYIYIVDGQVQLTS